MAGLSNISNLVTDFSYQQAKKLSKTTANQINANKASKGYKEPVEFFYNPDDLIPD